MALPFKQFISTSTETIGYPENVANYKYYDIDQIQTLKYPNKLKPPSLIHISVYPLNKDFEDFDFLLSSTNNVFDIIAASETKIRKETFLNANINLENYYFEFTPTKSSAGETLLHIVINLFYQLRHILIVYKANQLKSELLK